MREWIKSLGQFLAGLGICIAAFIYLLRFRAQSLDRTQELTGILNATSAELTEHKRKLSSFLEDPSKIISASSEQFVTRVWDQQRPKVAQALSYQDFTMFAGYYADISVVKDEMQNVAPEGEKIEKVERLMKLAEERLSYLQSRLHLAILGIKEEEYRGKGG